jgi:hypothetical protein
MDSKAINSISNQIYRKYPAVNGCQPTVQTKSATKDGVENYLLIFHGKATTADGKTLPITVRVTADGQGNILKVASSK